jgi:hypothetical protein
LNRKKQKKPTRIENPITEKIPRGFELINKIAGQCVSWQIGTLDKHGPWGWSQLRGGHFWNHVQAKLSEFERMTWQEIFRHRSNHPIKKKDLCPDAQKRLNQIKQDDTDELISLALSNLIRVWGIRQGSVLKVLWWDPGHTVCPSRLRNT